MNAKQSSTKETPSHNKTTPRFSVGDLFTKVPLNSSSSHVQAYHIYGAAIPTQGTYSYPYDYGLGLTSEGYATEGSMHKVTPEHMDKIYL